MTGDFGSSLTFLGSGNTTINSGYTNAVFIASYSPSGSLLWTQSQGSTSAVSARSISVNGGSIGVVGWHECTFESLSAVYGESTFNSLGFKDVFVLRYSAGGAFNFARNIGSGKDEIATGIYIMPDGKEVITGVFRESLYIPVGASAVAGLLTVVNTPNPNTTYCGDPYYGNFGKLSSASGYDEDGFTIKAINPDRAPLDMYKRFGSGCDLSIPNTCIEKSPVPFNYACSESIIGCAPYSVYPINFIPINSEIGFFSDYVWSPSGTTPYYGVTQEGTVSVTLTSKDGCYTSSASADVSFHPEAEQPLLSDNVVVNTQALNPLPILICPDDEVNLWCDFDPSYTYYWSGPGITESGQTNNETVTVSSPGTYVFHVANEFGCTETVLVTVNNYEVPSEDLDPFLNFTGTSDTLIICGSAYAPVSAWDFLTDAVIPYDPYDWEWTLDGPGSIIGATNSVSLTCPVDGWYVVSVEITVEENPCIDEEPVYTVTDSIYVIRHPTPVVDFELTGPAFACPGDTITLYAEFSEGTPSYNFNVIEDFGDSLYVFGSGQYAAFLTITNEFGCSNTNAELITIAEASTPSISVLPAQSAICPGDSLLLVLNTPGDNVWQGPSGNLGNNDSLYVYEAGLYFAEVTFYPGCALVSNTIQLSEYATPYLAGNDGVLCAGDSLEINIVSSSISNIEWQAPLSGSDSSQVVTNPGIYMVQVTSCNVVSELSIEVLLDTNTIVIEQPDMTPVCLGDSIFVQAIPTTYPDYTWSNPEFNGAEIYLTEPGNVQLQVVDDYGCTLISNTLNISFESIPPLPVFQYSPVCDGELQIVTINSGFEVTYLNTPDGDTLQTNSQFTIPEFYGDTTLYAFLSSDFCVGSVGSITLSSKPFPSVPILTSDAPVCTGTPLNLVVMNPQNGVLYKWISPTGTTFFGNDVNYSVSSLNDEGSYLCFADLAGCISDTSNVLVSLFETRKVSLPADTNMCFKANFSVRPNEAFSTYLWQNGSSDSIFIPQPGSSELLLITTDENGCRSSDIMLITMVDCTVNVPNVFTPNGDGFNDSWIAYTEEPLFFNVVIYNRWGRIVFESSSILNAWDGRDYKSNELCSEGVYYYILQLNNFEGQAIEQTGNLTLIRD